MRQVLAITGRELRAAFESPVAYATILIFVLVSAGLFYLVGMPIGGMPLPSLWEGGEASLVVLLAWMPLSLGLLVPALCMGSWTEERRAGTEELFLTFPLRASQLVLGKFLAHTVIVSLLLLLTVLPIAWTVETLGDLDRGTALVGLLGAMLLGAAYVSLALLVSACATDPLVAFLLSALLLLGLWLVRMVVELFPADLAESIDGLTHGAQFMGSAVRGVLDGGDLIYGLTLICAALLLNTWVVEGRRER
jgi:ABC-2 type transport system permease protein